MSYQVVARRWRPLTFASVIGQEHVTSTLANAIERDRVAHAFLFTGIRGVGKTTVARLLARALNCEARKGAEPCNECASCKQSLSGASLDVLEIDGASNGLVEQMRDLIEGVAYRPAGGRYRVYIIDEVHQVSAHGFNALLKTLEEPPPHVKFVMATTDVQKVPATVLSRCQRYDFRRLSVADIRKQLTEIVERDGLKVSGEALALIAREADGSMRDAQSLLEQVAGATDGVADAREAARVLGVAEIGLVTGTVRAVLTGDHKRVVEICAEIRQAGSDEPRFLLDVLDLLREVTIVSSAGVEALLPGGADAYREAAVALKDARSPLDLHRIFSSLLRTVEDLRRGGMPDLVLEMGLLKAASLESVLSASELLASLEGSAAPSAVTSSVPSRPAAKKPDLQTAAESPVAAPAPASATPDTPEAAWAEFLQTLGPKAGLTVCTTLSNCEMLSLTPTSITLRPISASRRALEDPEELSRDRRLPREFLLIPSSRSARRVSSEKPWTTQRCAWSSKRWAAK
jgi:DNA polymerase-3 subunit gamma/tau